MDTLYSITDLARDLDITPRTIRHYEDQGLLAPQRVGTTRVYSHRDRARLILILRGKRLGFSLKDIKEYLDLYVVDTSQVEQVRVLVTKVRDRIGQLEEQLDTVQTTLKELRDIERMSVSMLEQKGVDVPMA
ncbi:MerR family DNA-binding transcriptional regulator [Roseospira marina]|uniref:MerR family DNA-binding transcriptional regulator n=1 Tax=Roseospira marina TaxID=140057 RepID=A0A5M6ICS5_9PROT|nr:MerR family DNA-binding transcriptional regulator [Roseospira marina]KAA5606036.1 MerR family DNA-binding transcriptional regulator [Roseospira marina]MBB4313103.1 DNA-binding transcriptional MerR regulator [Roseospira marina]MBB5086156.1 DNA-binding transcriptional MerR regulator [Roseospira marina]